MTVKEARKIAVLRTLQMISMKNSSIMKTTTMMRMKHMMRRKITGMNIIKRNDA